MTSSFDKLVYFADCSPMEYYNLSTDPLETQNAYDPNEPRVALLWEALRPHIQQLSEADDEYSPCGADTW